MTLIRCTKKLQKAVGLKKSALTEELVDSSSLGPWHANLIEIDRCTCILFVNDKTLFNFLITDIPKIHAQQLEEMFKTYLRCVLAEEGFDKTFLDKLMHEVADIRVTGTNNKRILGSMNELAFMYTYHLEEESSVHSYKVPEIIQHMNRVPMGMLGGNYPIHALRDLCVKLQT